MEPNKFRHDDETYFNYIKNVSGLFDDEKDIIYNFPAYVGAVNFARFFGLYEMFKGVIDISGHVADIGTYKGASLLFFAKLIKIFEPYSQTEVHGFDWFKGMVTGAADNINNQGKYASSKDRLNRLIELQGFGEFCQLNDIDLTKDLPAFFAARPWLRYKCIFLDCGIQAVMSAALKNFWPRLVSGGILILDHFNNATSPAESDVIAPYIAASEIRQIPYSRSPTAFLIKRP